MPSPLLRLLPYFRPHQALLGVGLLGLMVGSALNVAGPLLVARAIDVDLATGDRDGLLWTCVAYAGSVLLNFGATWGSRVALESAAQRALLALKMELFDHLAGHDVAFHDRRPSGSLIGRVQGDIEALRVLFVEVLLALPADLVLVVGMIVVLIVTTPLLSIPVLAVLPVYVGLFLLFRKVSPFYFLRQRELVSRLTGRLAESVRSLPALRALGRHPWARDRARTLVEESALADIYAHWQPIWYFNSAQAIRALATVVVLILGAWLVAYDAATVGGLVMAMVYLRQVFTPLMRLSNQLATVERARASAVRVDALLAERPLVVSPVTPHPWPGLGEGLALRDVRFAYVEGHEVLHGIDLVVPAGARVGIVGATGSGKSTVLDLLLRFRDPSAGVVTIGGVDVRLLDLAEVRRRTGLVLQDVRLLPGTVLENLAGDPVAAQQALDALGIATPLHQNVDDASLSRGERQLLTFARALVSDPELLVLDEATSAIDPRTEARVQQALETLMHQRTVVIVAHRLQTVRRCDRIYVLQAGRVTESGSHDELVAAGGTYASLVRLQEAA